MASVGLQEIPEAVLSTNEGISGNAPEAMG